LYAKLAEKMGKSIAQLEEAVAYLTNESDKKKVRAMTEDLLNAYVMTRPNMKKIKDLRNSYQQQTAYFPRVREQGKFKVKLVEDLYNKEGMPIGQKEHFMKMFDRESEGVKVIKEIMDKYAKNGNLPANYHISGVERAISTPEFAYQGVNDINMQKVFDDAIEGLKIKEKVFDEEGNPIDVQDLIQDLGYQAIAKQFQSRGFAKRGIHRNPELVKGYEENDLQKILKNYMSGMTGIMTKQEAAADFLALMKDVSKENKAQLFSSLAKYGRGQLRNETKADEISSFARSAMFTWYLGGVVRPALIQLTQNFVTGIPKHAEYLRSIGKGGLGRADKEYTKAMRDIVGEAWGQNVLTPEEKEMEKRLLTEGVTVDQYIREIFGSIGPEHRRKFNKAMSVLATPFSKMEMFNRQSAALTRFRPALEIAKKKVGTKIDGEVFTEKDAFNEAFNSARDYVYDTHYAMSKANLPLLAQGEGTGVALKTLYTFKSFMHNFILSTLQQDWKTTMHSMAYMALFGGLMGLPFMKDIFEWVEREFGMSYTKSIRQTLRGIGGKTLENFGVNGLPAMLGANISGSLAIGVPFMGEDNMQTIGGVYEGQALKFKRAWDALKRGDYTRVAQNISPEFFRSPLTAVEQSQFGKEVFGRPGMAVSPTGEPILNAQGKPLSMTNAQAAFKALGFNPTDYGREQEMNQIIRRQEKWVTEKKANIAQTLKFDRLNGDPNALTKAKKATDELKQGIKDRGIQDLVPHFTFTDIVKASKKKPGAKERREARYKREELS
jgi:hypothetical protein